MKKKTAKKPASLRKQAEGMLVKQKERLRELSSADLKKLVHELGTHQIELEMQNEELLRAREELEVSRNKYAELYDFSPDGHFTVTARGLIQEANLTGAELLGVDRRFLMGKPFAAFIDRDDLAVYEAHRKNVFTSQTRQTCELRIKPRNATVFYARLQSTYSENVDDKAGLLRTALIDISDRKRAEEDREKTILSCGTLSQRSKHCPAFCRSAPGARRSAMTTGTGSKWTNIYLIIQA